jgi:cysteine desulfurase/selenocysteine lyase
MTTLQTELEEQRTQEPEIIESDLPEVVAPVFNVNKIREDFPILREIIDGKPLIYFDNGATAQKPQIVIDRLVEYYSHENANIHRGVHTLSQRATFEYEKARATARDFVGAEHAHEIIFTRGGTESINLVASSWGRAFLKDGDEVLITAMEHHANIVPWQLICEQTGAKLKVVPVFDNGELDAIEYSKLLQSGRVKIVAFTHISNTLGTINPVKEMIRQAHEVGAVALVDGAQAAPHLRPNVRDLDADFYVFSGHKVYGPTGIGVLYGKAELLNAMPPYQGGGDMIATVSFEQSTWNELPFKFEAGTPHIAGAIGLATALDYIVGLGMDNIARHEHDLLEYATSQVNEIPGLRIIGTAPHKAGILSLMHETVHPHDLGAALNEDGIAVRTGHHCTMPLMTRFGIPGTCRASFALYNTRDEIDVFIRSLRKVIELFS